VAIPFPENLHGALVALRMFSAEDPPWIQVACDRPEMARFIPLIPSPYTIADADAFVRYAQDAWEQESSAPFAITTPDGEPLGAVEVQPVQRDPTHAGIGYWLRPEARGRGAATEAVRLASLWAFDALHVERLSLATHPENRASQGVAERAGYKREGLLRVWEPTPTGRQDSVMFSLLPCDVSR
jgi:RimJ/RimL family protein N-acetyltransferase